MPLSDEFFQTKLPRGGIGRAAGTGGTNALLFPLNVSAGDISAPYAVIKFVNPHSDGLPIWGPSNVGVTVIRKISCTSVSGHGAPGYYAQFWYTQGDGNFNGANPYWGAHPYPISPPSGNTHEWEIAGSSLDYRDTNGGSPKSVVYGTTFVQAIKAERVDASNKKVRFYLDLPSTAASDIIDTGNQAYADGNPPSPLITIGDSPWYASFQHERFGGVLDAIKIFAVALSEADILSEAGDFSQVVTSSGLSSIWWGKNGFNSVDDLTCSYGTGRSFTRDDSSNVLALTSRL